MSGSFQVVEIIDTFVNYMENLERCICIVFDSTATYTGALGLKAIRLSDTFVEAYKEGACCARWARWAHWVAAGPRELWARVARMGVMKGWW